MRLFRVVGASVASKLSRTIELCGVYSTLVLILDVSIPKFTMPFFAVTGVCTRAKKVAAASADTPFLWSSLSAI